VRPLLAADCRLVPGHELVHVRSNGAAFTLRGKHVASWLQQLAPHLDGRRTIETLTASLPAEQREGVVRLIRMLVERGIVRDLDEERPHELTAPELSAFAPEIVYIDSFGGSGAHRLGRFRAAGLLVVGPPAMAGPIAGAARGLGMTRVDVRLEASLQDLSGSGSAEIVVACVEAGRASRIAALSAACGRAGTTLLPVTVVAGVAWIGPVVRGDRAGCWECAWRRLDSRERAGQAGRPGGADALRDPVPTAVLATRAAFEVFKLVTGAGTLQVDGGLVRLDLRTGESRRHRFHPHPLCTSCGAAGPRPGDRDVVGRWLDLCAGAGQRDEDLLRLAGDLLDPAAGILRSLGEEDLPQLPFRTARAVAADPSGGAGGVVATSAGETRPSARARAVRRALAAYARALLHDAPGRGGAWAWDLAEDEPAPAWPERAEPLLTATAAGPTWAAAVTAALLELCVRRLVSPLPPDAWPEIDLEAVRGADPDVAWTAQVASTVGVRPRLHDVTRALGVPAVAAALDGAYAAHAAAAGAARAVVLALEAVIVRRQLGDAGAEIRSDPGPGADRVLAGRLRDHGWRALATPADHDAAVTAACPYLAAVTLVPV
jgi:bacteriocin biosynthesis cyclodehydratase domain-containing protein